jgi:DNA polymerase III alpha subunit (gram-positive type)
MPTSLLETTFVIVDLETTGASPKKGAAITEIAEIAAAYEKATNEFLTIASSVPES